MLLALGANPITAYRALLKAAFGSVDALTATALKAIPLVLVGVGIYSDRILVMYEGEIFGTADPRTASREQLGLMMAGVRPDAQDGLAPAGSTPVSS